MLIGISGKIGSGKDTIGKIIQWLTCERIRDIYINNFNDFFYQDDNKYNIKEVYHIKKGADKLKDIVCILLNCTREQLEDREFKEKELGEEWTRYGYAQGHNDHYRNGEWTKSMHVIPCTKEKYEEEKRVNWQTAYKSVLTPRLLMQLMGTECGRDIIHPNIWVNSLYANYTENSNWIVTDVRFPNELKAIEDRGGITIRVNRLDESQRLMIAKSRRKTGASIASIIIDNAIVHPSETALDNAEFDFVIDNNGSIEELIDKVKEILITSKII